MPQYEFQSDDGEVITIFKPARSAPPLGTPIVHEGKTYKRIISTPQLSEKIARSTHGYPYVSNSLPQWSDGAEHVQGGRHDGKPIVQSESHERELCARHNYTKEYGESGTD